MCPGSCQDSGKGLPLAGVSLSQAQTPGWLARVAIANVFVCPTHSEAKQYHGLEFGAEFTVGSCKKGRRVPIPSKGSQRSILKGPGREWGPRVCDRSCTILIPRWCEVTGRCHRG